MNRSRNWKDAVALVVILPISAIWYGVLIAIWPFSLLRNFGRFFCHKCGFEIRVPSERKAGPMAGHRETVLCRGCFQKSHELAHQ